MLKINNLSNYFEKAYSYISKRTNRYVKQLIKIIGMLVAIYSVYTWGYNRGEKDYEISCKLLELEVRQELNLIINQKSQEIIEINKILLDHKINQFKDIINTYSKNAN